MYTKKEQRLLKKYERENDLMYPLHNSDADSPLREQFIKDLISSEDFVKTNNANAKKYEDTFETTFKKFGLKEYIAVLMFAGAFSGIFGGIYSNQLFHHDNLSSKKRVVLANTFDVFSITAIVIIGLLMGTGLLVAIKDANRELSIDKFYHRLSIRLFDEFHKFHPELKEEMLQHCNPEMARVITALIVANMPEDKTIKLQNIAMDIADYKYSKTNKPEIEDLKSREKLLNSAMTIIESYLLNNPELKDVVLDVYRGNIPKTFVLQQQNVR